METEAEKQLATLVSMPTMSDDIVANDMALDYIEQYFISCGLHCERNRFDGHGTLLASSRPDNAQNPTVLLAGHVDVMTGSDTLFKLRKKGDKLLGRGVYDMKFATAGYMQLASELRGQLDAYDFAILITTDEEYGNRDNINGTRQLLERGLRPSVCILPDSTAPGWEVERMAKASWRFDLIAKGISAHGSRPWEGESASFKLLHALQEIKAHFEGHGPETNTLNIAVIHGGETYNLIPDHMTAALEIRVINDEAYTVLLKIILDICK